ncbi:MAG: hypothetical protein ACHQ7N_04490 [Candidatus Methylomirabilales bacterium]
MKTWTTQAKNFISTVGKIVMALAFALVIVGLSTGPALAQERHGPPERGGHRDERHVKRGRRVYRPYVQPAPPVVYAPPPVVYAPPPPSPGISIIFPIRIR